MLCWRILYWVLFHRSLFLLFLLIPNFNRFITSLQALKRVKVKSYDRNLNWFHLNKCLAVPWGNTESFNFFINTGCCCSEAMNLANRTPTKVVHRYSFWSVLICCPARISVGTPFGLTNIFRGFTRSVRENVGLVPQFRSWKLPPILCYSLFRIIRYFDAAWSKLFAEFLKK
jgi:hypothetical protein